MVILDMGTPSVPFCFKHVSKLQVTTHATRGLILNRRQTGPGLHI